MKSLRTRVKEIPGKDGFWSSSSEETFQEAAMLMTKRGLDVEDTIEILTDVYSAVANEFGG